MQISTPRLSLAIVAYNEADRIARAIESVPMADEVVVLDSGSTDGTPEICRRLGARVVQTEWPGFVVQKNRALQACTGEWVLSLDADEWLTEHARQGVTEALDASETAGWTFPRASEWRGRVLRHGRWYPDRRLRLVRREQARWVGQEPVDRLVVDGSVRALDGDIGHAPYRSLREHFHTINRYASSHAETLRNEGVHGRRRDPFLHGAWHLFQALLLEQGYRDGLHGVAVASLGAWHSGLKWHRVRHP